jgi:DNA topoisomerase-2
VPQYNPLDLIQQIKRKLDGDELTEVKPWFRGYSGDITQVDQGQFITTGKFSVSENDVIEITELPIGCWTS